MKHTLQSQLDAILKLTHQAQYKTALERVQKLRRENRDQFDVDYMYAKILGDYADELPKQERVKLKREASAILRKLCRRLSGKSTETQFWVRSNYYYHQARFRDLIQVGHELVKQNPLRGLYAIAGGSALHAESLFRKNQRTLARKYAKQSLIYWEKYFKLSPREKFYFPYTLEAIAHAILGDDSSMDRLLKKAATLSRQKPDYWEFQEVRSLIQD